MKKYEVGIIVGIIVLITTVAFITLVFDIPNQSKRPNVILIMTDDLSVSVIDFLLENNMMPNLQKHFIDNGVTFTNSFVTDPKCCPSRATSLTGQYPHSHGVFSNAPVFIDEKLVADGGFGAFNDTSTIATWLKEDGYRTGYIGKYLNGYEVDPQYVPPGWDDWKGFSLGPNRMFDFSVNHNGIFVTEQDQYKTDYIGDRVIDFIKESDDPYFMYVGTGVPHASFQEPECVLKPLVSLKPVTVSPKYNDTLDNISIPHSPSFYETPLGTTPIENVECIEMIFRRQAESIRSLDEVIGKIFQVLIEKNELNNTVVIFTSDNGYLFGEHGAAGKDAPYEESIRVPLFIRAPSIAKQTVTGLVTNNDIAPTIADIAGIEPNIEVDGSSLLPIMKDPSKILRERFLIENWYGTGVSYKAIRSNSMLYVEFSTTSKSFYDLENDPYQLSNLRYCLDKKCLEKMDELKNFLKELASCGNGTCQEIEKRLG